MFHELVSHNDDLKRLVEKGYAIKLDSGHMVVRDVPYIDAEKRLQRGALVTKLKFIDKQRFEQENHQVFFSGSPPHNLDGTPIPNLGIQAAQVTLEDPSLAVKFAFSNKPVGTNGFVDFFEKIESYVRIISGPAMQGRNDVTPLTFRVETDLKSNSVFKFHDTLTSRAEIGDLARKFDDEVVAIIGLGGTGSYVLDYLVKTPVREIRAFDRDAYHVHNAFRSPGRLLEEGELGSSKADVYAKRYENFRIGLRIEAKFIDASCAAELDGVTFVFVAVDKGSARKAIFDLLLSKGIPFIDVGMGLRRQAGALTGMMRTTYYPGDRGAEVRSKQLAEEADAPDDEYRINIQISELNALNASLAVIRYKQLRGFYVDDARRYNAILGIADLDLIGSSFE